MLSLPLEETTVESSSCSWHCSHFCHLITELSPNVPYGNTVPTHLAQKSPLELLLGLQ